MVRIEFMSFDAGFDFCHWIPEEVNLIHAVRYWRTSGLMQVLIFFSMGSGEAGINLSQIQAASGYWN